MWANFTGERLREKMFVQDLVFVVFVVFVVVVLPVRVGQDKGGGGVGGLEPLTDEDIAKKST